MGTINFSFSNKNNILQEFDNWVKENPPGTIDDHTEIKYLRSDLKDLDRSLDEIPKGFNIEVTSPRVLKTVHSIAKEILSGYSSKIQKLDGMKIYYGYATGCLSDKNDYLRLTLDPIEIVRGIPDYKNLVGKIGVYRRDEELDIVFYARFLQKYLEVEPTLLNFFVGHEVTHYKYSDYPRMVLRECEVKFALYLQRKKEPSVLTAVKNNLYTTKNALTRIIEERCDREAIKNMGCAENAKAYFESEITHDQTGMRKEDSEHPSWLKRIQIADQFLDVPAKIPVIHFSFLEQIQEVFDIVRAYSSII